MKSFNLIGIIAIGLAITGLIVNIGHFFENQLIGWGFIFAGLAMAIVSTWVKIRKHKR